MKQILILFTLFLACHQIANAQAKQDKISYVSPKKDTLILPINDLGVFIGDLWKAKPRADMPVILFDTEEKIARMNAVLPDTRKKTLKK